jgi:hypothetical protein
MSRRNKDAMFEGSGETPEGEFGGRRPRHAGGSRIETITGQWRCLFTSEHNMAATADINAIGNR